MSDKQIKTRVTIRGFFLIGSLSQQKWLIIEKGTAGKARKQDPRSGRHDLVVFAYKGKDTASAPISYHNDFANANVVQSAHLAET